MQSSRIPIPIADQIAALAADLAALTAQRQQLVGRLGERTRDRIQRAEGYRALCLRTAATRPTITIPGMCDVRPDVGKSSWQHIVYSLVERGHLERTSGTGRAGHTAHYAITAAGREAIAPIN